MREPEQGDDATGSPETPTGEAWGQPSTRPVEEGGAAPRQVPGPEVRARPDEYPYSWVAEEDPARGHAYQVEYYTGVATRTSKGCEPELPQPARTIRRTLAPRGADTPHGPPPSQQCTAPKRVMIDSGKENTRERRDAATGRDPMPGPGGKPSSQWGSRPHPMFNMERHPGPARQPEYEVRHLSLGGPTEPGQQASTPNDDKQDAREWR